MWNFVRNMLSAIGLLTLIFTISLIVIVIIMVSKIGDSEYDFSSKNLASISGSKNAVGVVELEGEIVTSRDFREKLDTFANSDKIKAIVVKIDSPGGAVGASEEIFRYIKNAREKKPVLCSLGNIAASGGLYSSLGCEKVYTSQGTLTGSIGVILMLPNFKDVLDKIGVEFNVVKTGDFKDAGSPFRDFEEKDKEYLKGVAMEAFEQFINAISQERNIPLEKVREFADGRIILGSQAVKLGLADHIGGLKEASREALKIALKKEPEEDPILVFPAQKINIPDFLKSINEQKVFSLIPDKYKGISLRYQLL